MSEQPWPALRGRQSDFIREHGSARAERFQRAFYEGDPVADALFASGADRGPLMRQLRAALKAGVASETDAPEVQAFIADMRAALNGADW